MIPKYSSLKVDFLLPVSEDFVAQTTVQTDRLDSPINDFSKLIL